MLSLKLLYFFKKKNLLLKCYKIFQFPAKDLILKPLLIFKK